MYYNPTNQGYRFGGTGNSVPPDHIGNVGLQPYQGYNPMPHQYGQPLQQNPLGFGGGYYSGNYAYNNPYTYQKQLESMETQRRAQMQLDNEILRRQLSGYNAYHGIVMTEQELEDKITPPQYQEPKIEWKYLTEEERLDCKNKMVFQQNLQDNMPSILQMQMRAPMQYINPQMAAENAQYNMVRNMYEKIAPPDMGLAEYFSVAVPKLSAIQDVIEARKSQTNLTQVYDSKQYNDLLNKHKNQFGDILMPSIDDQEIKLPLSISNEERQARKKSFLDSIVRQQTGSSLMY